MRKLNHYLQKTYLRTLGRSVPVVLLALLFVLSIKNFKGENEFGFRFVGLYAGMAILEILPWVMIVVFYLYLNLLSKTKEYQLIKQYLSTLTIWKSLGEVWLACGLISLLYMGFWSPFFKSEIKSGNSLERLSLDRVYPYHGGHIWLTEDQANTGLRWRYKDEQQKTKMNVTDVTRQSHLIHLNVGEMIHDDSRKKVKMTFEEGEMLSKSPLYGNKYYTLSECFRLNLWGEVGFRLNHVMLIFLGTLLMWFFYEWFKRWSLCFFILMMLCSYLPLWSYVKEHRVDISFGLALLPSLWLVFVTAIVWHRKMRLSR